MLTINLEDDGINFFMDFVRKGPKSARDHQSTYPTPFKPAKNEHKNSENIRYFQEYYFQYKKEIC